MFFYALLIFKFFIDIHIFLPYPSSIFSLYSVNFIIYFLLRAFVISDGFTFVSSKIFILRPITPFVCVGSFTLGSHYAESLRLRPSFALPPLTDCPRHVLARSAASISRCCWDQPLRSSLALSSQSVLVVPALPPFALSYLSSSHPPPPPWPGEAAINAHASVLMQFPRNHRDVHAMPAVGSHETQRLQAKIRHDLPNVTRDES